MTQGGLELPQAQPRRSLSGNPPTLVSLSRSICTPGSKGTVPSRYGKDNEQMASQWLENCGYSVNPRGTVVSVDEPWLSACPDGVLNSKELLEIKCPVMGKGCDSLDDVFNGKASDVKVVEGTTQQQPHGPHGYYMLVQISMFCTGLRESKSLIWTLFQQVVIPVPYDA